MRHGNLDRETALGLKELRRRLEEEGNRVPASILDEPLNLATWNIRMSDHLPLWIQLDTWFEDERPDSMLERIGDAG